MTKLIPIISAGGLGVVAMMSVVSAKEECDKGRNGYMAINLMWAFIYSAAQAVVIVMAK